MIAGIIAAGHGSRLAQDGLRTPKPLVKVKDRPLCHWVVSGLAQAGVQEITMLVNSRGQDVPASLSSAFPRIRFEFLSADTDSSFESFRLVARRLAEKAESFLLSTVDALIPPKETARFERECRAARAAAGLALTNFVDDEKPLWTEMDANGLVVKIGAAVKRRDAVTCGLYYLTRPAAERLPQPGKHPALRGFWTELVNSGAPVRGVLLSKTLDVDRPEDLVSAETFLAERTS